MGTQIPGISKNPGDLGPGRGRSLQIFEQQLGAEHPDTASSLNNLAALYFLQGRYGEAEPLDVRSLTILLEKLGENHPNIQKA